jgi:hypothetical protein
MPCYRCGTRQVDPDRGESAWRRGVRAESQVLICPGCQAAFDWASDLDRCAVCSSVHLVRRLGEAECRDCGSVGQAVVAVSAGSGSVAGPVQDGAAGSVGARGASSLGGGAGSSEASLAEEVELALSRVLGTPSQRPPFAMS